MTNKKKIALAITAPLIAAALSISVLAIRDYRQDQADRRLDEERLAVVKQMERGVVSLLRGAEHDYPVPYVRTTLKELFDGVVSKNTILLSNYDTNKETDGYWALYMKAEDGRPMVILMLRYISEHIGDLAEKDDNGDPLMSDDDFQDWLVFFVVHEWYHSKHARIGVEDPDGSIRRQNESEAWYDGYRNVIMPARAQGRFEHPLSEHAIIGLQCYVKAHGDPEHPAWKSFIGWTVHLEPRPDCG